MMAQKMLHAYMDGIDEAYDKADIEKIKQLLGCKVEYKYIDSMETSDHEIIRYLVDNDIQLEGKGRSKKLVKLAYKQNNKEVIDYLVQNKVSVLSCFSKALDTAFKQGRKDIVQKLIKRDNSESAIIYCIIMDDLESLKCSSYFTQKDVVNNVNKSPHELMKYAVIHDRLEIVKYLHEEHEITINSTHELTAEKLGYISLTQYLISQLNEDRLLEAAESLNTEELKRMFKLRPDLIIYSENVLIKLIAKSIVIKGFRFLADDLPVTSEHLKIAIVKSRIDIVKYLHQDRGIKMDKSFVYYSDTNQNVYEYVMLHSK